jgi:hypothetical protein
VAAETIVVLYPVIGSPFGDEFHLGSAYPHRPQPPHVNAARMSNVTSRDFYEDDEATDEIFAAFDHGEKGRTKPPARGETRYLYFHEPRPGQAVVATARAVLHGEQLPVGSNL